MLKIQKQLKFTPYAWAKLMYLRNATDNEFGGFGITDDKDLLLVRDIAIIKQEVSSVSFELDPDAHHEYLLEMTEKGYTIDQCMRVWIHTHPGGPTPSNTDWSNVEEVYSDVDWFVMFINGDSANYCSMFVNVKGMRVEQKLLTCIDWEKDCPAIVLDDWESEYLEKVEEKQIIITCKDKKGQIEKTEEVDYTKFDSYDYWDDYYQEQYGMSYQEYLNSLSDAYVDLDNDIDEEEIYGREL